MRSKQISYQIHSNAELIFVVGNCWYLYKVSGHLSSIARAFAIPIKWSHHLRDSCFCHCSIWRSSKIVHCCHGYCYYCCCCCCCGCYGCCYAVGWAAGCTIDCAFVSAPELDGNAAVVVPDNRGGTVLHWSSGLLAEDHSIVVGGGAGFVAESDIGGITGVLPISEWEFEKNLWLDSYKL